MKAFERLLNSVLAVAAIAFVAACFVYVTVFAVRDARAAPLNDQQARGIYAVAYGQYGGEHGGITPMPPMPAVHFASQADICGYFGRGSDCPIYGYFVNGEITISEQLDFSTVVDASKLLHEYIHYLQESHGGPTKNCRMWLEREHEAYRIQMNVLRKAGEYMAAQNAMIMARMQVCHDDS